MFVVVNRMDNGLPWTAHGSIARRFQCLVVASNLSTYELYNRYDVNTEFILRTNAFFINIAVLFIKFLQAVKMGT